MRRKPSRPKPPRWRAQDTSPIKSASRRRRPRRSNQGDHMTDNKKTAVFGLYPSVERAERAVDELINASFSNADVSVLMADQQGSKDFAHEKQTKAPEGTTTGVAAGG